MRAIYSVVLAGAVFGSMAVIACSGPSDNAGTDESNVTADAGPDPKVKKLLTNLSGSWTNPVEGAEPLSAQLSVDDFGDGPQPRFQRDKKHTKQFPKDKAEHDREFPSAQLIKADSETTGILELKNFSFDEKTNTDIETTEIYKVEFKNAGGKATMTMTETEETVVTSKFNQDGEKTEPTTKKNPVRAPYTLERTESSCFITPDNGNNEISDCSDQFFNGLWKPTNTPAECKDKEQNCMRCEAHRCQMKKVSSCELDGKFCFESAAACQFQEGEPAGQVSTITFEGAPIDCKGSPGAKPVCCDNIFSSRREGFD